MAQRPISPLNTGHANNLGGAEGVEAVDDGDADLDFCGLAGGVSCGDACSEGFEPSHFIMGILPAPSLPAGSAEASCRPKDIIVRPGRWTILLPETAVSRMGTIVTARVRGWQYGCGRRALPPSPATVPICSSSGGLHQQVGEDRAIALVVGANSASRMSSEPASIASMRGIWRQSSGLFPRRLTFLNWRRRRVPWFMASHSLSHGNLIPPRRSARSGGASLVRCPPACSTARKTGGRGSAPRCSSVRGSGWARSKPASRVRPSQGYWQPGRLASAARTCSGTRLDPEQRRAGTLAPRCRSFGFPLLEDTCKVSHVSLALGV